MSMRFGVAAVRRPPGVGAVLIAVSLGVAPAASAQEDQIQAELDAYWADVVRAVQEWDIEAQKAGYHPDAVSVSGSAGAYATRLMSSLWREIEQDPDAAPSNPGLEFRFSTRVHDADSAHEVGMYRFWADGREEFFGLLEAYLVKKDGRWMVLVEEQLGEEGRPRSEWDALASSTAAEGRPVEPTAADWVALDPEDTLYIEVPAGRIVVALAPDLAPGHATQMRTLARAGYFDGLQFYRVIEGFLAQGGDYSDELPIPAEQTLKAEFAQPLSEHPGFVPVGGIDQFGEQAGFLDGFPVRRSFEENLVWFAQCTGVIGLGRWNDPDTASAHFWIALQPKRGNERQDTKFGRVVWGMEHVSRMTRTVGEPGDESMWTPIVSVRVAADVPVEERTELEMFDTNSAVFLAGLEEARNPTQPPGSDWFVKRPRHLEVCEIGVPVREVGAAR